MGNVFGTGGVAERETQVLSASASAYVTAAEKARIRELFQRVEQCATDPSRRKTVEELFDLQSRLFLRSYFVDYYFQSVANAEDLEQLVVNTVRMTTLETLRVMLQLASVRVQHEQTMVSFWNVVVESCLPQMNLQDLEKIAARFSEFTETLSTKCGIQLLTVDGNIDSGALNGLLNNYLPYTTRTLETLVSTSCFRDMLSPSYQPFLAPRLDVPSEIARPADLLPLALQHKALQGQWKRLYSTSVDGLSFNRIVYHCLGYDGPTCVLIRCLDGQGTVLGAVAHERWKDSNRFFGSSQDGLFVLSPKLRLYRSKGGGNGAYQWLNTKSPTLPRGMGFGGTTDGFRLFIPESLEGCTAASSCPTFETGRLIDGERFEIHTMEVWGCGGAAGVAAALAAQQNERALVDENIRKARQVDKAQFFNNEFDREFFLANSTSHGQKHRNANS